MPTKRKSRAASKKPSVGRKAKQEKEEEEDKNVEVSDEEEDESEEETDDEDRGRGKRKRRESKSYEPDDFTMASVTSAMKAAAPVAEGRGKKLGDIDAVNNSIKKVKLTSDELMLAYKFLFSNRGIANKKMMKDKLLDFSGYLPPLPKGKYSKQKLDDDDEVIETKFAIKAFKMNVNQIKTLCNFFAVDYSGEDGKSLNKDDMIDRLCDFLGEPDESMIKQKASPEPKKKAPAKSKKTSTTRRSVATKVVQDPYSLIKDYKKGKVPSDAAMRQWVKAYIVCVDMETATTKDAVLTASAKFGVDMASKKARIKELLAEEI